MHFRNVKVQKPYERYTEVFIDEGENDMFAVMKELVKQKYTRLIYPEHPRGDRLRPRAPGVPAAVSGRRRLRRLRVQRRLHAGDDAGGAGVVTSDKRKREQGKRRSRI